MGGRTWVVGVDPGKKGAFAFVSADKVEVYDMDIYEFRRLIGERQKEIIRVFIEKQQPFPKQGVVSTGRLMQHYGQLMGILIAYAVPFEEVPPQRWQRVFLGNAKGRKNKKRESLKKARQLFPNLINGNKDGQADALLIAEYGRRVLCGL